MLSFARIRTQISRIGAASLATATTSVPALAAGDNPQQIFANLYRDLGLLAVVSAGMAGLIFLLQGLRDAGYLSERWRFFDECDPD